MESTKLNFNINHLSNCNKVKWRQLSVKNESWFYFNLLFWVVMFNVHVSCYSQICINHYIYIVRGTLKSEFLWIHVFNQYRMLHFITHTVHVPSKLSLIGSLNFKKECYSPDNLCVPYVTTLTSKCMYILYYEWAAELKFCYVKSQVLLTNKLDSVHVLSYN